MDDYNFRLRMEKFVIEFLEVKWESTFVATEHEVGKRGSYAPVDGFFIREGKLKSIIENRNRKESWSDVQKWGGILINYDKLVKGISIAQMLGVSFLFVVYFFNDNILIYWKLVDEDGMISTEIVLKRKLAQKSLQDGVNVKKERNVGILSNKDAIIIATDLAFEDTNSKKT